MVKFSPDSINDFLECPTRVKNRIYVYDEDFEYSEEIVEAITRGKCNTWGPESRLFTSKLTVKYNVQLKLGSCNWFPTTHTSSILKEMAILLYAMIARRQFNLGQFIFDRITDVINVTSTVSHIGYPALITQYLL